MRIISKLKDKIAMSFITNFLASLIDKFKVANPTLFLILQFVVGIIIYSATTCEGVFEFCGSETFEQYKEVIVGFLLSIFGLTGSRTTSFLKDK